MTGFIYIIFITLGLVFWMWLFATIRDIANSTKEISKTLKGIFNKLDSKE